MSASALHSFRHGVHPAEHKDTADLPIARFPFGERFTLHVGQHIGAPAEPTVTVGQRVARGEPIAKAKGFVSVPLHAPVTGRVVGIGRRRHPFGAMQPAIEIEIDPFATQRLPDVAPVEIDKLDLQGFVERVQQAGLVGMGGAAFPSHVKYKLPEGKRAQWLIINGCECEPYLTCDHRVMVERAAAVVRGCQIVTRMLKVEGTKIGVEINKKDAIAALRRAIGDDQTIEVVPLKVKYPQGAEKMLIRAILKREVPAGGLPIDIGLVVNNVSTMGAIADYFDRGQPLIERVLTVAGPGIERPANLIVPIGTPVRDVLQFCGLRMETRQVVMGGPMMGQPLASLDVPVLKGTSGLLAFTEAEVRERQQYSCVRCGRCLDACANFLNPSRMARLARAGQIDELEAQHVMDCMECGGCTYACPSGLPLVQMMRTTKARLRDRAARKKR